MSDSWRKDSSSGSEDDAAAEGDSSIIFATSSESENEEIAPPPSKAPIPKTAAAVVQQKENLPFKTPVSQSSAAAAAGKSQPPHHVVTSTPLMTHRMNFTPPSFDDSDIQEIENEELSKLNLTLDAMAIVDLTEETTQPLDTPPPKPKPNKHPAASKGAVFLPVLPTPSRTADPSAPKVKTEPKLVVPPFGLGPSSSSSALATVTGQYTHEIEKVIGKLLKTIASIPKDNEFADNPPGLRTNLYDHQRYGLQWLWWREHNFPGGGILADEMGLGKTVMILSLIMKSKAEGPPEYKKKAEDKWLSSTNRELIPSRSTLIIVPPGVLGQWESEINTKTKRISVTSYHGPKRDRISAAALSRSDIVLSTFQTVLYDIPKEEDRYACTSPLMRVNWERIVLDEGHYIRNASTHAAYAACKLNANHRWVVTGTPVHNRPSDMHSLVKFLRLTPFDDPKLWDFWIGLKAVSRTAGSADRLNTIGKALILRRTKTEVGEVGGDVPSIPPKTVTDIPIVLSEPERKVYDHLKAFAESQFRMFLKDQKLKELQKASDNYVAGGARAKKAAGDVNYTHVFTLILRLRQCSVAPFLIHSMIEDDDGDADDTLPDEDDIISKSNPIFDNDFVSSKLKRLYEDIDKLKVAAEEKKTDMDKVVIVSQWTTLLDIIDRHLKQRGYSTCTISGQIKVSDRMEIMNKFNVRPRRPQIMLLSIAAGGCGLNLIGANHMFLMDIHWNPQQELQAQDRIHRFGQKKDVHIYRYVSEATMEENVVELQKGKLELATALLSHAKKNAGGGLTITEMRQLFNI